MKRIDLTNKKFGHLTVLSPYGSRNGSFYWNCICNCGVLKVINGSHLRSGNTSSCGCQRSSKLSSIATTHGCSNRNNPTPEYKAWGSMKERCLNKKHKSYHNYGGRGIRVCDRWIVSFENFLSDMGERPSSKHSLDRFPNNNGDYEPSNCRWATMLEQSINRRTNTYIEYNGNRFTHSKWANILKIDPRNFNGHLKRWKSLPEIIQRRRLLKKLPPSPFFD